MHGVKAPVPIVKFSAALGALLLAACGMLIEAAGRQEPIFSEAQAYERFMGR